MQSLTGLLIKLARDSQTPALVVCVIVAHLMCTHFTTDNVALGELCEVPEKSRHATALPPLMELHDAHTMSLWQVRAGDS